MSSCKINNTITIDKDGSVNLDKLLAGTNVKPSDVCFYSVENDGQDIIITLFDNSEKKIKVKKTTRADLARDVLNIIKRCSKSWFPRDLIDMLEGELDE